MKTNGAFNKITVDSANRKPTKLGLAHDVNTTSSIGDTQPLLCRQLLPKSKTHLSMRHLIRLDPMVAPTYGRLKAKCWNHFVGLSDLLPRTFPAMLSKVPIAKGDLNSVVSVPLELPNAVLCDLSVAMLVGSSMTVYFHAPVSGESPDAAFTNWRSYIHTDTSQAVVDFKNWIGGVNGKLAFGNRYGFPGYNGTTLELNALGSQFGTTYTIPINCSGITDSSSLSHAYRRFLYPDTGLSPSGTWEPVPLNSANYVLRTSFTENGNTYDICFAVRLSAFGKRIRKILIGLGYQPNLSDAATSVDITPLFAYYKAYWDTFGLTLYDNWETTAAARLLASWDAQQSMYLDWTNDVFCNFIYDLGTTFVTEPLDYISAHQASDVVDPSTGLVGAIDKERGWLNNIVLDPPGYSNGVSGVGQVETSGAPLSVNGSTGHVFINRVNHTEVDAELLKTLYKWTNRQTVAGKRIAELLEAAGYGDYVKASKSNFIGYEELDIDVSDINATADSTNAVTGKNSDLGTVVGKGIGVTQNQPKHFEFDNDELGYWVTIFAIAPESGYCQGLDPVLLDYDANHKYNPDFDGLGMELQPKSVVFGASDWVKAQYATDFRASFGMVPRHSKYKVAHNILNGEFSLRGLRDGDLPYVLDKYLSFGDRECELIDSATYKYSAQKGSDVSAIPIAGNAWRFLNRYKWLANFERIFTQDEPNTDLWLRYVRDMSNITNYELYAQQYDHFVCMNILDLVSYARVLPIADSYGTTDENNGDGDMTMTKA